MSGLILSHYTLHVADDLYAVQYERNKCYAQCMSTFTKWRPNTYAVVGCVLLLFVAFNLFIMWHAFSRWNNHFYSGVITNLAPETITIRNPKQQEITVSYASTTPVHAGASPGQLTIGMLIMIDGERLAERHIMAHDISIVDVTIPGRNTPQ